MVFDKNSGLVKVWASLVVLGIYKLDQVPQISNLKQAVSEVIDDLVA
ncbi:hypothetical protein [Paenibacillus sp. UMB4589-SE434]|nr:hypothetical protein [Paenibacillus sp. UMB4589-SE434]MDK8182122.1 hypothetical protein [Paenibacillus sp. UMB4589-SE434]